VAECVRRPCVRVRPARVRVRANRYMLRAESASPPPMGVPVCSWLGACAQVVGVVVAAHTPDPVRVDAVATSAIRVRISTGSSPLHSDARGTHHFFSFSSFFVLFFTLSFLVFCQRTLTQRLALAHTDTRHQRTQTISRPPRPSNVHTITRHRTGVPITVHYCGTTRFAYTDYIIIK